MQRITPRHPLRSTGRRYRHQDRRKLRHGPSCGRNIGGDGRDSHLRTRRRKLVDARPVGSDFVVVISYCDLWPPNGHHWSCPNAQRSLRGHRSRCRYRGPGLFHLLDTLREMGAGIAFDNRRDSAGEPVYSLLVVAFMITATWTLSVLSLIHI